MMVEKYIKEYCKGFDFKPCEKRLEEICGITVESKLFLYQEGINRRTRSHVTFKKDSLVYECDCVDIVFPRLSLITLSDKKYLCFSRCLYGFELLNIDTLHIEYEYFPQKVLNNEESFVVVEARNFGALIIFDGCYWAYPYGIYAYDHSSKSFFDLSGEYGLIYDVEGVISDEFLTLTGCSENNEPIKIQFTEQEVRELITQKGSKDF